MPKRHGDPIEAPCDMRCSEPYPFAWCETHDEVFALGDVCPYAKDGAS